MKISQVKVLLKNLKDELVSDSDKSNRYGGGDPSQGQTIQYKNLIALVRDFLPEHQTFTNQAHYSMGSRRDMISSLNYLNLILDMKVDELGEKPKKLLDSAWDKLEKAGTAFNNNDLDGASNKLNTCIELALKDVLDIPTTIKGINVSKIIDIMIAEKIGPVVYLEEVKSHVLHDNFVKHQGVMPPDARILNAISATENLLKKLPKEPFIIQDNVREKLWSGVRQNN